MPPPPPPARRGPTRRRPPKTPGLPTGPSSPAVIVQAPWPRGPDARVGGGAHFVTGQRRLANHPTIGGAMLRRAHELAQTSGRDPMPFARRPRIDEPHPPTGDLGQQDPAGLLAIGLNTGSHRRAVLHEGHRLIQRRLDRTDAQLQTVARFDQSPRPGLPIIPRDRPFRFAQSWRQQAIEANVGGSGECLEHADRLIRGNRRRAVFAGCCLHPLSNLKGGDASRFRRWSLHAPTRGVHVSLRYLYGIRHGKLIRYFWVQDRIPP